MSNSRLVWLAAVLWLAMPGWLSAPASAQVGDEHLWSEEDEEEDMFEMWDGNRLTRSDMEVVVRTLGMTTEQRDSAMDLYSAYDTAFKAAYKKLADVQTKLHEGGMDADPEQWKKLQPIYEKYNEHVEKLRETLVGDLQLTLTDEQKQKWPRVEKKLGRKQTMAQLMASGSRADLSVLVQTALGRQAPSPELAQVIEQYELELDRALEGVGDWQKEQENFWKEQGERFAEMTMEERMAASRKAMQEGIKRTRGVRETNLRFLPRMAELLPEDKRYDFENEFYRRTFWGLQMFEMGGGRRNQVERAFDAIAKAKAVELSSEQREKLLQIRRGFEGERRAVRDKRIQRIIDAEDNPKEGDERMGFGYIQPDPEEMRQAWEKSGELEKSTMEKLRALFSSEQLEKIGPPLKVGGGIDLDDIDFDE